MQFILPQLANNEDRKSVHYEANYGDLGDSIRFASDTTGILQN